MPHQPTKPDLSACFHTYAKKRLYCILAAVFFAVGIFGNLPLEDVGILTECAQYVGAKNSSAGSAFSEIGGRAKASEPQVYDAAVLPYKMAGEITASRILDGVDDFQIAADAGGVGQNALRGMRAADYLLFAEVIRQFFGGLAASRRLWGKEKRICRFYVVKFIHRTDGKKKFCFA